jgi:diguanylate cyclase (GGDEF)-like protein
MRNILKSALYKKFVQCRNINYLNKIIKPIEENQPLESSINLFKDISGAGYCGIILLDEMMSEVISCHSDEPSVKMKADKVEIPIELLRDSIKDRKVIRASKEKKGNEDQQISEESKLNSLLLIPGTGKYGNLVIALGNYNGEYKELFSKKKISKLNSIILSSEHILNIYNSYEIAMSLSWRDDLTKAYNRRFLDKFLIDEINRAERNNTALAFIFFDLNNFRSFNDNYGHYFGSKLLILITKKIMESVRGIDKLVRFGGDEFCVVLPGTTIEGAKIVSRRILEVLKAMSIPTPDNKKIEISACFGISSYPEHALNEKDLICEADRAMYAAKESGESITVITKEISKKMKNRKIDIFEDFNDELKENKILSKLQKRKIDV